MKFCKIWCKKRKRFIESTKTNPFSASVSTCPKHLMMKLRERTDHAMRELAAYLYSSMYRVNQAQ
jgi:hypothetical protein